MSFATTQSGAPAAWARALPRIGYLKSGRTRVAAAAPANEMAPVTVDEASAPGHQRPGRPDSPTVRRCIDDRGRFIATAGACQRSPLPPGADRIDDEAFIDLLRRRGHSAPAGAPGSSKSSTCSRPDRSMSSSSGRSGK